MPIYDEGWSVIYALQEAYEELTRIVPCPTKELCERLTDKRQLSEFAEQYGIPIPRTFRPRSRDEALALRAKLPYPVLLKPRKGVSGIGIRSVNNAEELSQAMNESHEIPVIQERIEGDDLDLTILCFHGRPLAGSAYLSLRNAPLPFGPPVACRTIQENGLMRTGMEFLAKLRYHGVAHLDFRMDRRDGKAKLLECNPRFAGTNEISTRSGVDFALMLYRLALGETVEPCLTYEVGLEFRWLGELRHLVQTPYKSRTLRDLLRWDRVATEISIKDPIPHGVLFFDLLHRFHRRKREGWYVRRRSRR
jgi:predicted ATP-grasp superfamily ATP-dependent carboligase